MPFETFRRRVESERFGIVITAHPTFALARELRSCCLRAGAGRRRPAPERPRAGAARRDRPREHRPDRPLDLDEEHRQSLDALVNLHGALHQVYDLVFEVAEELYPERWTELSPRLVTFASWVGYDLDGRSDIPWTATFAKRLKVQILQLERYRAAAARCAAMVAGTAGARRPARAAGGAPRARDQAGRGRDGDLRRPAPRAPAPGASSWRAPRAPCTPAAHARLVDAGQLLDLIERAIRLSRRRRAHPRAVHPARRDRGPTASASPIPTPGSTRARCTTRSARRSAWITARTIRAIG